MIKLNLGCGPHLLAGWDNYDFEAHPGVIQCDLSRGVLPYEANTVDFVFSEHFIEHITKAQFTVLLKEVKRVLKPGGVFRVSTPNLKVLAKDYLDGKFDRWKDVWYPESPCALLNGGMRLWGHQYLYDYAELVDLTIKAGLSWQVVTHRSSNHPELRNLEVRPYFEDLILELIK